MKKLILLCAMIGFLSQLNGMEQYPYYTLPKELQQEIVNKAFETSNSVDQVINIIKKFGMVYKVPYTTQAAVDLLMKVLPNDLNQAIDKVKNLQGNEPKDFTKLVHLLADKFNQESTESVAALFNTQASKQYIELGKKLMNTMAPFNPNIMDETIALINQGADAKFSKDRSNTVLKYAEWYTNASVVQLLKEAIQKQSIVAE